MPLRNCKCTTSLPENLIDQKRLLIKPSGHGRQTHHDMV